MERDLPLKILAVIPYAPNRVRTRPYHLIRTLAAQGHEVTLATTWSDAQERQDVEEFGRTLHGVLAEPMPVRRSLWNCLRALPGSTPLQACYSWSPRLSNRLAQLVETSDFDVVHVEHLRGVRYGLTINEVAATRGRAPAMVWDSVDCISGLFRHAARTSYSVCSRAIARLELARTEKYEGWAVGQFDRVLATSDVDGQELSRAALRRAEMRTSDLAHRVVVVPNGVDLEYFCPTDEHRMPVTLVMTGKMSYHANVSAVVHFAREVMPLIWKRHSSAVLWIVGKDPAPAIRKLGTTWNGWLPPMPASGSESRIQITGTVGDMRPFLRRATVAVAPILYGAGIQNKVLEALACGTPVVATPQAVSALRAQADEDLVVAKGARDFAAAVSWLLSEPERRAQFGYAGRRFVEQNHDWAAIGKQLSAVYRNARA